MTCWTLKSQEAEEWVALEVRVMRAEAVGTEMGQRAEAVAAASVGEAVGQQVWRMVAALARK